MINQLGLPTPQLFARRLHSSSAAFARNLEKLVDETMMEAENARKKRGILGDIYILLDPRNPPQIHQNPCKYLAGWWFQILFFFIHTGGNDPF